MKKMPLEWISGDGKLLLSARILRTFAYGFLSIILAIYLKHIGLDEFVIGIVLSATLANSVIFTLFSSFYADRIGRRKTLMIFAGLMSIAGFIFLISNNYVVLILAAFIGTINVTGSETGSFLSIEQAILPQTITDMKKRNDIFALYNMVGTFAMSAGVLLAGLPQILQNQYGLDIIESMKPLFIFYILTGVVVMIIYFMLSKKIELSNPADINKPSSYKLTKKTKGIVTKLSALFVVDSFAGGFVIQSIVSFWFFTKFGTDLESLSIIFSIAGVLTAFSFILSSKIANKIGLIHTMVFSHISSNVLLILVAFAPNFSLAVIFYLARMSLSQMDVPARQSYVVGVVNDDERIAATGITNTSRSIAQSISPSLAGVIIQSWVSSPFVIGGLLKIAYDIGLFLNFRKIKPPEEN
jgi:MFS family permease